MEITPRIHSIPAEQAFYTGPQSPNVFLVRDGDEGALIDSGFGDEKSVQTSLDFLKEHPGVRLKYIILTHHHFDHSSGAAGCAQRPAPASCCTRTTTTSCATGRAKRPRTSRSPRR